MRDPVPVPCLTPVDSFFEPCAHVTAFVARFPRKLAAASEFVTSCRAATLFAGVPRLGLEDEKLQVPDEAPNGIVTGFGVARKAAVLQAIAVAGLRASSSGLRKPPHMGEQGNRL
jgi:hypothetical protein